MFSDPKYSFSVCQKYFFVISKKVNIFHRIQPNYDNYNVAVVDPIPFLLPGRQQTVGAVRVPPGGLGLLEPGEQHGLQRDHVVVGERQGLEPGKSS